MRHCWDYLHGRLLKYLLRSSSDRGSERGSGDGVGKSEKVLSRTYGVFFVFDPSGGNHDIWRTPVDLGLAGLSLHEDGAVLQNVIRSSAEKMHISEREDNGGILERGRADAAGAGTPAVVRR